DSKLLAASGYFNNGYPNVQSNPGRGFNAPRCRGDHGGKPSTAEAEAESKEMQPTTIIPFVLNS
ncbi:hypothetical protein L195_g050802, partial [Trifolium pratense]